MQKLKKYISFWLALTKNSFLSVFVVRTSIIIFLLAKILRFVLYFIFLQSLFSGYSSTNGYTPHAFMFVYMTFIVIDSGVQLLFREVYRFRPLVVQGDFDLILIKPLNPLFRVLLGGTDPIDFILLFPFVGLLMWYGSQVPHTIFSIALFVICLVNSLIIATGFHIFVLAITIITSEIDHTILIYRDLTSMGRIPIDLYKEPLRSIITFVLPVGIMMTLPAKVFMNMVSVQFIALSSFLSIGFLLFSLLVWKRTLMRYSSASS